MGKTERKEAAKERKETAKAEASAKAQKDKEDAYWRAAGEGERSKAAAKKDEADKKKQEAAARKAELKRLAEEEEAKMAAKLSKPSSAVKITKHQLDLQREQEQKQKEQEAKQRQLAARREMAEDQYATLVTTENRNREEDVIEARNVSEALAALEVDDKTDEKHPEKRVRAAWLAFEARMLPELKQEKPGLKMSQYKDMLWKMWQKSPDNPLVQAAAAAATSK